MIKRNALLLVAGAAIFALDGSTVSAQAKHHRRHHARSEKRIPISKEAPKEAEHVDTVTVYRTDTLRTMGRVDTVTNTVTNVRVDTVMQRALPYVSPGGAYIGVGAGPNLPFGAVRTVNEAGGLLGQLNLGYQRRNSPLGIRFDANVTQFAHNADYAFMGDKPLVFGGNLDLRLNLPFFNNFFGSAARLTPYLIGGGSGLYYRNLRMQLDTDKVTPAAGLGQGCGVFHAVIAGSSDFTCPGTTDAFNHDFHHSFGFNFGGGLAMEVGKKEVFAEARAIRFNRASNNYETSWFVPIVFGVNFF